MRHPSMLAAAALVLTVGLTPAHATALQVELLVNGNAEAGDTRGWVSAGMQVIAAGSPPGMLGLPPGTSLGNFSFTGGTGAASGESLTQSVAIDDLAALVDSGALRSSFSVLVQSRSLDPARGELRFLGATGAPLALFAFADPVSTVFDWGLYGDQRTVPVGTRAIEVYLTVRRTAGVSNDGYFDNASLVLSAVPEPASAWLLLAGLPLLAALRRPARNRGCRG